MSKDRQVWLFAASLIVAITASPVAKAGINDDEFLDNTYPATTTVGALARVGEGVDSEGSNAASISAHYPFSGSAYGSASAYASSDELAQQVNATATVNTSLLGQSEGVGSASLSFYFKTIFSHADAAGNALVSISGNYSIPNQPGADQSGVSLTITNTLTNSLLYSLSPSLRRRATHTMSFYRSLSIRLI